MIRSILTLVIAVTPLAAQPDTSLYQQVLTRYVQDNGTVRYAELRQNLRPLETYVAQLARVSPDSNPAAFPTRDAKLAYWLNAYNALVLHAFARDYPDGKDRLHSAFGRYRFFFRRKFVVGGQSRTLDDIESRTIRGEFRDPRVHFALVCASTSCPWLSREAYDHTRLAGQLERATSQYLSQSRNFRADARAKVVYLPKIFDWFQKDWGRSEADLLRFVARYRPQDAVLLQDKALKVRFFDYDWSLNDAR